MTRTCDACGKPLPAEATAARRYCDATCRYHKWLAKGDRPTLPTTLRWYILERDDFRCRGCGAVAGPELLTVDHIVPLSGGGKFTDETNLQTLCVACNNGKGGLTQARPRAPWWTEVVYWDDEEYEVWVRRTGGSTGAVPAAVRERLGDD